MSEPVKVAEPWNVTAPVNINAIGLEEGHTYRVSGYYGGESLDSSDGATKFEVDIVAINTKDFTDLEVIGLTHSITLDEATASTLDIAFIDGLRLVEGDGAVLDSNSATASLGWSGMDNVNTQALSKNAVIESITEVDSIVEV